VMRPDDQAVCQVVDEMELLAQSVTLNNSRVVEPGCGTAQKTRWIAEHGAASVVALEVDTIQHEKNLAITDLPNVQFMQGGAESIPLNDGCCDLVVMFKSLHHVPVSQLDKAMGEIARVLRPGGTAWISEPIYKGNFNELLSLFHDEREVRMAAYKAVVDAVSAGVLESVTQLFFNTASHFASFSEFDSRILSVTHTDHRLSPELRALVEERFSRHLTADGAHFEIPIRVDLLRRPVE
jgi:SAM-dependent methyltransferase